MLPVLIAAGAITTAYVAPPASSVVVPAGALTAVAAAPAATAAWARPFDPSDRAPYALDWSAVLDTNEKIASIVRVSMSALGASLGVQVDSASDRLPVIDTAGKITGLWFLVASGFQADTSFVSPGVAVTVSMLIRTDSIPYRDYERSAILTARQL